MAANWGLRGKSVVALLLACALALVPAVLLGWRAMDDIRTHFGLAYAKNFTLLHRQKILAPVSRELALSRRFAESVVTRDWLLKEDDPARRALFFREAEGYRGDFRDHAYFIIASGSQHYYFNDGSQPYSERPRYTLEAGDPEDAWYFNTLRNSAAYNINVNVDSKLNLTKVWFNLVIRDQGRPIGLAGSGLDLSGFLDDFIIAREPGVTPMIVGDDGAIQAHPDRRLIAYSSAAGGASERHRVFDLLDQPEQRDALREAMRLARAKAGSVHCLWAGLDAASNSSPWPTFPSCAGTCSPPSTCTLPRSSTTAGYGRWRARSCCCWWPCCWASPMPSSACCCAPCAASSARPRRSPPDATTRRCRWRARTRSARCRRPSPAWRPGPPAHRRAGRQGPGAHPGAGGSQPRDGRRAEEDRRQPRLRQPDPARDPPRPPAQRHARRASLHPVETARRGRRRLLRVPRAGRRLPDRRGRLRRSRRARRADDHARPRAIDHAIEAVGSRDPAAILGETDQAMRSMLSQEQIPQALATNMDAGLVWVDRRAASWPSPGRRSRCTPATARRSRNSRARAGRSATSAVATTATSRYRWRRAGPST